MTNDLHALWDRVERHLRTALDEIGELPAVHRGEVEEYLEYNELGLAFEHLIDAVLAERFAIPARARRELEAAAREMGFADDPRVAALAQNR